MPLIKHPMKTFTSSGLITIFLLVISVHAIAQTYPVSNIIVSIPKETPNNLADWANSNFSISASTFTENGKIDEAIQQSRILVIIK